MNATDLAAWVGAVTGVCAVLWDFYKWKTSGPILRVSAYPDMLLKDDRRSPDNRYVEFKVCNTGTANAMITSCGFFFYDSWFARIRLKPARAMLDTDPNPNQPLPHKLDVGEEWIGIALQDDELNGLIKTGKLWCYVIHSWSKKPIQVNIRPLLS